MTDYLPGSFFVVDVPGPGGFLIGLAQSLVNDASRYKHAGLILDTDGTVVEAEPEGARLANISEYAGAGLLISDAPVQSWMSDVAGDERYRKPAEEYIRAKIVTEARKLVGTPYSFADYAAIGLLRLRLPSTALRRYVASSGHMQCAQLVDAAYLNAGVHLFSDGREPGEVCPADLAAYAEDREGQQ